MLSDILKDCTEAAEKGYGSREIYIQPSQDVDPYLVYCDMDNYKDKSKQQFIIEGCSRQGTMTVLPKH